MGSDTYYRTKDIIPVPRPSTTAGYETDFQATIIQQMRRQGMFAPYEGAVRLVWCAFYPPVKSDTNRVSLQKVRGEIARMSTPDLDNIEKVICDAANKYVWRDDAQVIESRGMKIYSNSEGIRFRVYKIDPVQVRAVVDEEFKWPEEDFSLTG